MSTLEESIDRIKSSKGTTYDTKDKSNSMEDIAKKIRLAAAKRKLAKVRGK